MACKCHGGPSGMGRIQDLSTSSLMPRYAPTLGGDDDSVGFPDPTTGQIVMATVGWLTIGGVVGAALWVAGKELLKH